MKLSVNDANKLSPTNLLSNGLELLTHKIGTQLGAIENIKQLLPKYKDAIVVKIIHCQRHPNANKLSVCLIDDGGVIKNIPRNNESLVTVVCGASNVSAGQMAVWLPPNSTVPSSFEKEEFILSARDLRGVISYGMLASPEELDLNYSTDGILTLTNGNPGDSFSDLYDFNDTILELENKMFTHRPDCFGVIGVARELSAIMGERFISPEWYTAEPELKYLEKEDLPFNVSVKTKLVPRFSAISMQNIKVTESPITIKSSLIKAGIKPINSVVDIANYIMLLTAQPIHIYDYDKVAKISGSNGPTITARNSLKSEKLHLLNGKQIAMVDTNSAIIATDKVAISLGGIMGGSETEVDKNTTNVIIEVANFDMYNIRKSSMKYGLFTDGVTRNTKKQSPHQTVKVLVEVVNMLKDNCGGVVGSNLKDVKHNTIASNKAIEIDSSFINERLGTSLNNSAITEILERTEFKIINSPSKLTVTAPFWRTDITTREDLVEEVGRLYGFDKLPITLPVVKVSIAEVDGQLLFNRKIRENLCAFGANELMTYSFVNGKLLENAEQPTSQAIKISNALSPNLEYYRLSLTPNLLEKVRTNQKLGYEEFAMFEIGKVHSKTVLDEKGLPAEKTNLALVYSANKHMVKNNQGAAYYMAKKYLSLLGKKQGMLFEFKIIKNTVDNESVYGPFMPNRSAEVWIGKTKIGIVGEYKESVSKKFKLPEYCSGFEINLNLCRAKVNKVNYKVNSKFPGINQDITVSLPKTILFSTVNTSLLTTISSHSSAELIIDCECIDIYQKEDQVHYSFSIKYTNYKRTQTIKEINTITEKIVTELQKNIGAKQVK